MIARAITVTTGVGLQLLGVYAIAVTLGAWVTIGLYAVGALAVALQHVTPRRTPCSPGE